MFSFFFSLVLEFCFYFRIKSNEQIDAKDVSLRWSPNGLQTSDRDEIRYERSGLINDGQRCSSRTRIRARSVFSWICFLVWMNLEQMIALTFRNYHDASSHRKGTARYCLVSTHPWVTLNCVENRDASPNSDFLVISKIGSLLSLLLCFLLQFGSINIYQKKKQSIRSFFLSLSPTPSRTMRHICLTNGERTSQSTHWCVFTPHTQKSNLRFDSRLVALDVTQDD